MPRFLATLIHLIDGQTAISKTAEEWYSMGSKPMHTTSHRKPRHWLLTQQF